MEFVPFYHKGSIAAERLVGVLRQALSSPFGSVLREYSRPDSDVEVLVEFEEGHVPGFFGLARMEKEPSALLGGRKVDLRTPRDLSRYFREEVLTSAVVQYARG